MTREEAEIAMRKGVVNNEDYIQSLNKSKDIIKQIFDDHEALQQPKSCDGCWYGKTTINSVICGKNGTYKEADDYCKYYNPKEQ